MRRRSLGIPWSAQWWVALSFVAACGCGVTWPWSAPAAVRITPTAPVARSAMEAALAGWMNGNLAQSMTESASRVELVDWERVEGRRLGSFQIVGQMDVDQGRGFVARLGLLDPDESRTARFVVIGEDPIWVFREEDYHRILHWEHKMEDVSDDKQEREADTTAAGAPDSSTNAKAQRPDPFPPPERAPE